MIVASCHHHHARMYQLAWNALLLSIFPSLGPVNYVLVCSLVHDSLQRLAWMFNFSLFPRGYGNNMESMSSRRIAAFPKVA